MERWPAWFLRRVGRGTLLALGLLLLAVSTLVSGVSAVVRPLSASLLLPLAVGGLLAGWGLGRTSLRGGWSAGGLLLLGLGLVAAWVGRVGSDGVALLRALATYGLALQFGAGRVPDSAPLTQALAGLVEHLGTLLLRLWLWGQSLAAGTPLFDPIAVSLLWSLVLWLLAAWAGWWVSRALHPLVGLAPALLLLGASTAYTEGSLLPPLLLLGSTLLLLVLAGQEQREQRWKATHLDYSLEIRADLALVAVPSVLLLLLLAILVASFSPRVLARLFRPEPIGQVQPLADSLGLRPPPRPDTPLEPLRASGMPRNHLLGAGPELAQTLVMTIRVEPPPPGSSPPRYYWRGLSYDRYSGTGWHAGALSTVAYEAGEEISASPTGSQQLVRQQVEMAASTVVHAAGSLLRVNQPSHASWRSPEDLFGASIETSRYEAESLRSVASESQLRAAGSAYPAWVRQRYLALPEAVPERVRSLAYDLTATAPTPYDRARAIESYLRAFPYTVALSAPPPNRELADYFLFDLRRGYCDYYATAMVVLARAAGIPARLVVGYATGRYDVAQERYLVSEAEAHSWPELYFPGYGWVEFEPTASRPSFDYEATLGLEMPPQPAPTPSIPSALARARQLAWPLLALLPLGLLAWHAADQWWLRRQPTDTLIALLYRRLLAAGQRLGVAPEKGQTPHEFVALLDRRLTAVASGGRAASRLVAAGEEARWLTQLYVKSCYSGASAPLDRALLLQRWLRLHRWLWLAWLLSATRSSPGEGLSTPASE